MLKKLLLASCVSAAMLYGVAQATPIYSHDAKFDDQLSFSKPFTDSDGMFEQYEGSKSGLSGDFNFGSRSSFQYGLIYRGGKYNGFSHHTSHDQEYDDEGEDEGEGGYQCGRNCESVSVPEPATLALFGLGLLGFGLIQGKKRHA